MTSFFLKKLEKKYTKDSSEYREQVGVFAGWIGLFSNFILFLIKLFSGIFTGSISIMTDAINNLSDSSSSLITLVGFKLAAIPADEEHPYGHARYEYISGLLVACIIILIGGQFLINSVKRTMNPQPIEFSLVIGLLLALSIVAKLIQGVFYKKLATDIDSTVLLATSIDSRNDVISTLVVLVSCVVQYFMGWQLDGPMGILVSLFVLYSGIDLLKDTLTPLIGSAPEKELVKQINEKISKYPTVLGIHDLMVHNYGPESIFATVHVEVPASQDILVSHDIIDNIERDFLLLHNIHLVIHLDPVVTNDSLANEWEKRCKIILKELDSVLSLHDFRIVQGNTHTNLIFDITVPPRYKMKNSILRKKIQEEVFKADEKVYTVITIDRSYISYIE